MKKVLIIGFLFGAIIPFLLLLITRSFFLFTPGLFFLSMLSKQQISTLGPPSWGEIIVGLIMNIIAYTVIFWIFYFLIRKLRNKTPIQTS